MIRHDPDGYVGFFRSRLLIADASGQTAYQVPKRFDGIDVKDGSDILHRHGQTLQAHSGIDVLLNQIGVMAVPVIVELGEHDIPDFHVAVALAAHHIFRTVPVFLPSVVIDLRAGTAGAGAVLPEIVLFSETVDVVRRDMHIVEPDIVRLVVVHIDRRIEPFGIKPHALRQELPCPGDRLLLEIIAEGKVSEHLEESAVPGCLADIFKISGADAFLAGSHPASRRNLLAGKPRLHRRHAGIDDEKRLVIMRNQ